MSTVRTTITVGDVVRIGGCQGGLARAIALGARVGIPADAEVDFETVLQTCREHDDTFLENYFLTNKAKLLEYTNSSIKEYVALGTTFNTLEEAISAVAINKEERRAYHNSLTTVAFTASLGEDQQWLTVDDNFSVPPLITEYHFHVFNHMTGAYVEAKTLEEVHQIKNQMIDEFLSIEANFFKIQRRMLFAEDGVSTTLEDIE